MQKLRNIVAAVLLMAFMSPAMAQTSKPQVWTTNIVPGEFPSQHAALAAVRAQGGVYALAEVVEKVVQAETLTTFVYGATSRGMDVGPWYRYLIQGCQTSWKATEAEAIQCAIEGIGGAAGCPPAEYLSHDAWTTSMTASDGTAWQETVLYYYFKFYADTQTCTAKIFKSQAWRERVVECPANLTWSSTEKACVKHNIARISTNPQPCNDCDLQHNPVNVSTGDKYQVEADFTLPWLSFSRHYHSTHSVPEARLGSGWTHDLNVRLYLNGTTARGLVMPHGGIVPFPYKSGIYEASDGSGRRIVFDSGSSTYSLHEATRTLRFDAVGKLTKVEHIAGDSLSLQYDTYNRLTTVTHSSGRSLTFEYDPNTVAAAARLTAIKSDGATLVNYEYDSGGRLEYARYPNGPARRYHYEDAAFPNHLTGVTDETNARFATYGYNADGLVVLSEHAGGLYRGTFAYQADGATVYTDANGRVQTFGFTSDGAYRKITGASDAAGTQSTTYALASNDFRRRPLSRTDKRGVQTTYSYADMSDPVLGSVRLTTTNEAVGTPQARTIQRWNELATTRLSKTAAPGTETVYQRNTRGQPLTVTTKDTATGTTRTATTTYCEQADVDAGTCPLLGLVTSVDGPRTDVNDVTTYTYYPSDDASCAASPTTCPHRKGDLWMVMDAMGNVTETLRYDGAGRVLAVKDANGVVTDFEYHPRGWLTARKVRGPDDGSEADDQITRIDYYPTGLVQKTTLPDGRFTAYTYDAAHRLTDITDGEGNRIHYTLDNAGNRTKEETIGHTGDVLRTLSRVYNQLGQLQTHKDAYAHATGYGYDANGNTDTVTDALGRVTDNDYDPLNRLTRTIQDVGGLNVTTRFQYDARDNLTEVVDPKGLSTRYTYNGLGDLTRLESPDTGVTTYTYDSAGNRATQTDARGVTATYGYDALNRLTSVSYPDSSLNVGYQYDTAAPACASGETFAAGRLSQMLDGSGSAQYCYDRFGQLVRKVQTTAGQSLTVRYAYTKAGQLSAVTYPDGTVADYVRDALGRTTQVGVTPPGQPRAVLLTAASYYPFGPAAEWVFGNGRMFKRSLNQNYQPGFIEDASPGGLSLGYEFDPVGNLIKLRLADQGEPPLRRYAYDTLNRLTEARDGATDALLQGYSYDATGNRTSATEGGATTAYDYAATSHRLLGVGGAARSYDANGNTIAIGAGKEFVYNDANRMSAVKQGGVTAMSYAYSGKGEQVRRYSGTTGTVTVYDEAGHWLGEYDGAGVPTQQMVWLEDLPVGLILGLAAANQPLHYIEADALGTPRTIFDAQRNVAVWNWPLTGEAFGNDQPVEDVDGDGTALTFNLRFPGQRYDAASGLNYNYFREYEKETGRYTQPDPIGMGDGPAIYAYVNSRPLLTYDPFGLTGFIGFPPDKEAKMREAVRVAIAKMQACKCKCWSGAEKYCIDETDKAEIIANLETIDFRYVPQGGGPDVAAEVWVPYVNIYPLSFSPTNCSLASTLAHEANHYMRKRGIGEGRSYFVEELCFGCKHYGGK